MRAGGRRGGAPWLLAALALVAVAAALAGPGCKKGDSAPSASQVQRAPAAAAPHAEEAAGEGAHAPPAPSAPEPAAAPEAVDDQVDEDPRAGAGEKSAQRPRSPDPASTGTAADEAAGEGTAGPPVTGAAPAGEEAAAEEPADPYAEIEAFFAGLPQEAIVFHVPRTAPLREAFVVRLVVQPGADAAALKHALVELQPGARPGDIHTREAKLAPEMQATLTSPTLQIVARGADTQLVRSGAPTEWSWDVTAPAGGSHRLTLALYAVPRGRGSGIRVKTFDETLVVQVPFLVEIRDVIAENWEWMWTLVVGPLLAVGWRRWRRTHPVHG